jgi:hypothetical protein
MPGTVSKILWHFTGGPTWNAKENRQNKHPKSARAAYAALVSILQSRELRIGQFKEVVKVRVPYVRKHDPKTDTFKYEKNVLVEEMSVPVCCLADIPVAHLSYHSQRYGKFAIGFHRETAITHHFNPVFYTLHDAKVVRSIYEGFSQLKFADTYLIRDAVSTMEDEVESAQCEHAHDADIDITSAMGQFEIGADDIETALDESRTSFRRFLAFVKTFDRHEFSTIYCEREWRAVSTLKFSYADVAMIVLPRKVRNTSYYEKFVSQGSERLRLPRSIPVVPWEDIVES